MCVQLGTHYSLHFGDYYVKTLIAIIIIIIIANREATFTLVPGND